MSTGENLGNGYNSEVLKKDNKGVVEDWALGLEMATVEDGARSWAAVLAKAIEDPTSFMPGFARIRDNELNILKKMGITPEQIIDYGERSAERIRSLAEYSESLEGSNKAQLAGEYVKQLAEGLKNNNRRKKEFDEDKDSHLMMTPREITQSPEFLRADDAYLLSIQRQATSGSVRVCPLGSSNFGPTVSWRTSMISD